MKAKYLLPLTAAAMFALTACDVEVSASDDSSSSSVAVEPESSSSVESSSSAEYTYKSRIDDVKKDAKTYCTTKSENAGLNGYLDASISGFGTIAVTVNQDMDEKIVETILEMDLADMDEEVIKSVCEDMIDEEDVFSSCDVAGKKLVSIANEDLDHVMNNSTMTKALDELCEVFESFETEMVPEDTTYSYKYLTYCEIIPGATEKDETFYDCEALPVKDVSKNIVSIKAEEDGETYSISAYYGDEEDYGLMTTVYTLNGFDTDSLGSYWEFEHKASASDEQEESDEVIRVYGGDFTVLRAKDDSYYYSWSQWDDLYKKLARKYKAIKK